MLAILANVEKMKMGVKRKFWLMFILINIFLGLIYLNRFEAKADFITDMENQGSGFVSAGKGEVEEKSKKVVEAVTKEFSNLGQLLTMIGSGVMVAVVSYMGIKYIISPPDKQAALKQQLIGVVVAGVVIFGAYGIWSAVLMVVSNF